MIVKFVEIGRFPVLLQMFWWFYTGSLKNEKLMIFEKMILHLRDAHTPFVFHCNNHLKLHLFEK